MNWSFFELVNLKLGSSESMIRPGIWGVVVGLFFEVIHGVVGGAFLLILPFQIGLRVNNGFLPKLGISLLNPSLSNSIWAFSVKFSLNQSCSNAYSAVMRKAFSF